MNSKKNIAPNFSSLFNKLKINIRSLKATGPYGFEGLIRVLFGRLLKRPIYLMKSGTQGGGDAYSGTVANMLTIVLEDKLYNSNTKLPVDQLVAKLDQATRSYPEMDIWLIVTTKELSSQHVEALQKKADDEGVGVIILDWSVQSSRICAIAALCAQYSDVLPDFKISLSEIDLMQIKSHPQFPTVLDNLESQLATPELSYTFHCEKSRAYLKEAFENHSESFLRLGCYGNINANKNHFIERKEISKKLDDWWENNDQIYAIVDGREGRGKSWAVFHWIDKNIDTLPLTLVIPAQKLKGNELILELSAALKVVIKNSFKDLKYFQKKLIRYRSNKRHKLLIVIDGLNQNYSIANSYEELFLQAISEEWSGTLKIILTVRTSFLAQYNWLAKLNRINNDGVSIISVSDYNEEEQRELLATHNLQITDFEKSVLNLFKVPRYADLIIKHSLDLKGITECSIEHIFLLDWKDRLDRRSNTYPITQENFLDIIRLLAKNIVEQKELNVGALRTITKNYLNINDETLIQFVDELSQDSWLQCGRNRIFMMNPIWTSTAFALLLNDELFEEISYEDTYAKFIEPMNSVDQISDIVLSAIFLNLITNIPQIVRAKFLTRKFLKLQNHSPKSFERFHKVALINFDFFTDQLTDLIHNNDDHRALLYMKKMILWACKQDSSQQTEMNLRNKINEWLGCVHMNNDRPINHGISKLLDDRLKNVDIEDLKTTGYCCKLENKYQYGYSPHEFCLLSEIALQNCSISGIINWLIGNYLYPINDGTEMSWLLRYQASSDFIIKLTSSIDEITTITDEAKSKIFKTLSTLSARPIMSEYIDRKIKNNTNPLKLSEIASKCLDPGFVIDCETYNVVELTLSSVRPETHDFGNADYFRDQRTT